MIGFPVIIAADVADLWKGSNIDVLFRRQLCQLMHVCSEAYVVLEASGFELASRFFMALFFYVRRAPAAGIAAMPPVSN